MLLEDKSTKIYLIHKNPGAKFCKNVHKLKAELCRQHTLSPVCDFPFTNPSPHAKTPYTAHSPNEPLMADANEKILVSLSHCCTTGNVWTPETEIKCVKEQTLRQTHPRQDRLCGSLFCLFVVLLSVIPQTERRTMFLLNLTLFPICGCHQSLHVLNLHTHGWKLPYYCKHQRSVFLLYSMWYLGVYYNFTRGVGGFRVWVRV